MRKILALLFLALTAAVSTFAQTPQIVPYQAVARDATGNLLVNQNVCVQFSIYNQLSGGTLLYQEHHTVTTNKLGLFNVSVGTGGVYDGGSATSLSGITWGSTGAYMEVGLDLTGTCSGYTPMGRSQMQSVPYALYAASAPAQVSAPLSGNGTAGSPIAVGYDNSSIKLNGSNQLYAPNTGTVTSIGTSSPITGGTISGSGTIACPTCVTTTGGGALSATVPASISAAGNIAVGYDNSTIKVSGGNLYAVNTGTVTSITASLPLTGGTITGSGTIGIGQASGSANGYLASGDWTTFNNKISGASSANYVPHWTTTSGSTGTLSTTSLIYDNGTYVGIGVSSPTNLSNVLHIGAENGQGIDIGNPNDQLNVSGGGSYAIRFYGYRDVTNYGISAKISAQRTYVCCSGSGTLPWLEQGTDLVFSTNGGLQTGGSAGAPADNTTEVMRVTSGGTVKVANLAGTGYRPVYADASGNLYTISGSSSNKVTFPYSGGIQSWTVPGGVNLIFAKIWGAGGGSAFSTGDGPGGGGGFVSGFINVTPGSKIYIVVGGGGAGGTNSSGVGSSAYGGGGKPGQLYSGGGGGYSGIFNSSTIAQSTALAIAGGGGGGGKNSIGFSGGGGGGLVGAGGNQNNGVYNTGTGGNQIAGGVTLTNGGVPNYTASFQGSALTGGNGSTGAQGSPGGGGGWYGGGAGGISGSDGGAGGGSSYISGFISYMPIRNEQGMTAQTYFKGYTLNINNVLQPGGTDAPDYVSGVGLGGYTVSSGTTGITGGNGYVTIYY